MEAFWQLVTSVAAGVGGAFLAVNLALHRFYREKWWERRLAAYLSIFEALHKIRSVYAEWEDEELTEREPSEDYRKTQQARKLDAESDLRKAIDVGEFLIAVKAVEELRSFFRGINSRLGNDPAESFANKCELADTTLAKLRDVAQADLHLTPRFTWLRRGKAN